MELDRMEILHVHIIPTLFTFKTKVSQLLTQEYDTEKHIAIKMLKRSQNCYGNSPFGKSACSYCSNEQGQSSIPPTLREWG